MYNPANPTLPILSSWGNGSKSITAESGSTFSTVQTTAEACKAIKREFLEFMRRIGEKSTLTPTREFEIDLTTPTNLSVSPPALKSSSKSLTPSSPVAVAEAPSNGGHVSYYFSKYPSQ